jgi:hypothetical protein
MKKPSLSSAAALLGRKGGAARGPSKRRDVDYAELGRKGGIARAAKALAAICTRCGISVLGPDDLVLPCILPTGHEGFHGTGR